MCDETYFLLRASRPPARDPRPIRLSSGSGEAVCGRLALLFWAVWVFSVPAAADCPAPGAVAAALEVSVEVVVVELLVADWLEVLGVVLAAAALSEVLVFGVRASVDMSLEVCEPWTLELGFGFAVPVAAPV